MKEKNLYCGAWNSMGEISGIKAFKINEQTGLFEQNGIFGDCAGQSILVKQGEFLIAVSELNFGGAVISYKIEEDGTLVQTDKLEVEEPKLSYVSADPVGTYVYVSCMGKGVLKMIRLSTDGKLTLTDERYLTGHGVTARQMSAKLHSCMASPDGNYVAAANFGADEVSLFEVDRENERLCYLSGTAVDVGQGPRHMAFHPSAKYLYVLTELGSRVYVFNISGDHLEEVAVYPTKSPNGTKEGMAADIVVSPDGKYVYASNRGQHNVAVWKVDTQTGYLNLAGYCPVNGKGPRGICISMDGIRFVSANCNEGTVTVFERDAESGMLVKELQTLNVPAAGCVRLI